MNEEIQQSEIEAYIYVKANLSEEINIWFSDRTHSCDANYDMTRISRLLGFETFSTNFTLNEFDEFMIFLRGLYTVEMTYATKHSHSGLKGFHIKIGG